MLILLLVLVLLFGGAGLAVEALRWCLIVALVLLIAGGISAAVRN